MNAQKIIREKKKMILVILMLITGIVIVSCGVHFHTKSVRKKEAEKQVETVIADLQKGDVSQAEKLLGRKGSEALYTEAMSSDDYMHVIVKSLGYTTGDEKKDASSSWRDLLTAGNADDSVVKNMKKLDQALQKNCITSWEMSGTELKDGKATVKVNVTGIIRLPKVSFLNDVQKANQKLADYVNHHMDDLIKTYHQAGDNGDSTVQTTLQNRELNELIPTMTKQVRNAKKVEETWVFTVNVSSDQPKITEVSVSQ